MTAGEKIRKRRRKLSITRRDFAKEIGVPVRFMTEVELDVRNLRDDEYEIIANALQCSVSDIMPDVPKYLVNLQDDGFGDICECAVCYCLCRPTNKTKYVCDYITPLLPNLPYDTLEYIKKDIDDRKSVYFLFDKSFDHEEWDKFYDAVCTEIERRKP